MFKYGLYLLDGEQNVFKEQLVPVEGMLYIPGTKVVAVWGELQYKGSTLVENLPYKEEQFDENAVDTLLKKIIKRLKDRVDFIESLQGGQNGNSANKPQKSQAISITQTP
ncbi:hypothetical protein QI155_10565 [Thermodesulfovibrio sp. 1176]|uniref:hypothetical protein n=1 Tax=Thermodesulfovibrio sp. 1176 TaxID=3043424 RepID=UPI002482FEFB|nr:hypothetical protein [Thermodesulfovibrio sp. 1176]MDI1472974.1 hypothetical protein [Thermodesulfovibrio sp. 1176]